MSTVDLFLKGISKNLRTRDAVELKAFLLVEPPIPNNYFLLKQELQQLYQDGTKLEKHIEKLIPENEDVDSEEGDTWPGFLVFMKEFLQYWRDVDFDDLLGTYSQLSTVVYTCITALSNPSHGIIVLPTVLQLSQALVRLATMLEDRPDLTRKLRKTADADQGETKTLVEGTAETIQRAFTVCLTERTSTRNGIGRDGKPEGKKIGIYSLANMVLKLLFKCRKTGLANQIFTNITQNSPPLGLYIASERVTYLYFLGRFLFDNDHFYRAQLCLQSAYDQCRAQDHKQRRRILIYLLSANMILGRFPSQELVSRPEARDLMEKFIPIAIAIKKGDLISFKRAFSSEIGNEEWFFRRGIYLPLLSRCEVLVWRSLARRVFLLTGQHQPDPNTRKAPTLDIADVLVAAQYCQKILEGWHKPLNTVTEMQSGRTHTNMMFMKQPALIPPPGGRKKLRALQGVIFGNKMPKVLEIEAVLASLVQQGFLRGFISHNQGKFAILGSKQRGGPLNAGFPPIWEVLRDRAERDGRDSDVPGWVQHERRGAGGGVVNLTGVARPVGSG